MVFFRKKIIHRLTSNDSVPYMIRWNIFQCKWFSIKIHRILLSDDTCLHDHPWAYLSIILRGGYVEQSERGKRLYGPGSILYRKAEWAHRLEIFQPATTLVITFKKIQMWGFFTKNGWVPFYDYDNSNSCE